MHTGRISSLPQCLRCRNQMVKHVGFVSVTRTLTFSIFYIFKHRGNIPENLRTKGTQSYFKLTVLEQSAKVRSPELVVSPAFPPTVHNLRPGPLLPVDLRLNSTSLQGWTATMHLKHWQPM